MPREKSILDFHKKQEFSRLFKKIFSLGLKISPLSLPPACCAGNIVSGKDFALISHLNLKRLLEYDKEKKQRSIVINMTTFNDSEHFDTL